MVETIQRENLFSDIPLPPKSITMSRKKKKIVGQKKEFDLITKLLQEDDKQLLIIPITGSPGIGKTTLARSIHEDPRMKSHFDIGAWITVSQDYTYQKLFSKILNSMESEMEDAQPYDYTQCDEYHLSTILHQQLYNRRYLIVMDGMCEARFFFRVRCALPDTHNGNRILVTSNMSVVAKTIQSSGYIHEMQSLSLEDSWELLCDYVFGDDPCPPQVMEIGRRIVKKCKGLPLSITEVGDLLSQQRGEIEHWKRIEEDNSYKEIWYPSYCYLPAQFKGCFFDMGGCF